MYHAGFECTLLEVKVVEGLGTTIDVVLVNGEIHDSDTIVVCGMNGPIVTPIRALLTTPSMKELRIKSDYVKNKTIKAAMGVKISAQNLEGAVAGTNVLVYREKDEGDNLAELKHSVMEDFEKVMSSIATVDRGVYVQASTLGALEALLEFLASDDVKIPVCGVQIGPVHKKDVVKSSVMLEHKPEWAVILAFDVKVNRDAKVYAEKLGVKIFTADIIYHLQVRCHQLVFVCLSFASSCTSLLSTFLSSLQDMFVAYTEECTKRKRETANDVAVFPVALGIVKCFREKNPILLGVEVLDGILKIGTPICVPAIKDEDGDPLMVGRITSIQDNHKEVQMCKKENK